MPPGTTLQASVHIDLDGACDIYHAHGWDYPYDDDPIFESGMDAALAFLDRNQITATLFVVASAVRSPARRQALEKAVRLGHEIASHTVTHANMYALSRAAKRRELSDSRALLEDALGVGVMGYRAPGYRVDKESIELLAECGYRYDSSAFPTDHYVKILETDLDSLKRPFVLGSSCIVELPLPDYRPSPVPFSPSYAHILGMPFYTWYVRRQARRGLPFVLLFHLIDFAEPLPSDRVGSVKARVLTLSHQSARGKLGRCQRMIDGLRSQYEIVPTTGLLEIAMASPVAAQ